jgi:threonylcarbamoyladenosine tRNA methylthiotransferase MtaB
MERTISFYTFGCKVNQYETERLKSLALKEGWEIRPFGVKTEYIFINSCSVTHIAERKARRLIRFLKNKFPESKIILAGCYSERLKKFPSPINGIDVFLDNKEKWEFFKGNEFSIGVPILQDRTRALIKIQDGCNNFCSYCIVPYLRGRERSKPYNIVLSEIENYVNLGYREIVLTGVRLGAYGHDFGEKDALTKLLEKIIMIPEIKRIRLSSIEPMDITPSLIDLVKEEKICKHWHITLQSGDNEILRKMGRKYDTFYYYKIIEKLREKAKDIAIATDIIVGYPGENDDNFNNTLKFIKEIGFMKIHVFPFSPRPGTFASNLPSISSAILEERKKILLSLSDELWNIYARKFINKEMEVLVEEVNGKLREGLTENYLRVVFEDGNVNKGDFVKVKLKRIEKGKIFGEMVKDILVLKI